MNARPISSMIWMRPPAPGLRARPAQASPVARPWPIAPPAAAMPSPNGRPEQTEIGAAVALPFAVLSQRRSGKQGEQHGHEKDEL